MRYCDLRDCMSSTKSTARLVAVCQKDQTASFEPRQVPIHVDEHLIMKLQFDGSSMTCDHRCCSGINRKTKVYEAFIKGYKKLTIEELNDALCVPISQIKDYLLHSVPCIGCRTSIDNFIKLFNEHRHAGLEPLFLNDRGSITMKTSFSANPDAIYTLFHVEGAKLKNFTESIPKSKKNRRCNIHSFDKTKSINEWEIVWDAMNKECQEEITLVEADCLLDTIEHYLRKHKFCSECKLKVLEAYDILMDHPECKHHDRKGFCPALYEGLRSCPNEKHVHVEAFRDYIGSLIARAEPDIEESRRERHAKTLDVAQEEILTCIGIYLFERFDKLYRTMRSEEQTWQLLFYISIDCLRLNFEKAVDRKQDFSMTLELLCEEFRVADEIKEQKKQQKRSKRKARRQTKANEAKSGPSMEKSEVTSSLQHVFNGVKADDFVPRRRSSSCCSCLCHYCDKRSNSLSIIHTTIPSTLLVKSHSCPTSLLFASDPTTKSSASSSSNRVKNEQTVWLSSSLETLFSSVSTRDCVCHERNPDKQQVSCDECPSSSSMSCIRCSSTRTDLGYSSGQDDISSLGLCECSMASCNACLIEAPHCCPLHEEDENSDESGASISPCNSVLSSGIYSHNCCVHDTFLSDPKTIELYDRTRRHKLKLQLSHQYPFFHMDLKEAWDDQQSTEMEDQSFISEEDLLRFSMLNKNVDFKRAQQRSMLKAKFQAWQQKSPRFPLKF